MVAGRKPSVSKGTSSSEEIHADGGASHPAIGSKPAELRPERLLKATRRTTLSMRKIGAPLCDPGLGAAQLRRLCSRQRSQDLHHPDPDLRHLAANHLRLYPDNHIEAIRAVARLAFEGGETATPAEPQASGIAGGPAAAVAEEILRQPGRSVGAAYARNQPARALAIDLPGAGWRRRCEADDGECGTLVRRPGSVAGFGEPRGAGAAANAVGEALEQLLAGHYGVPYASLK